MKTRIAVFGCVALFAFGAFAQDVPTQEAFLGYTYTRVNSDSNIPAYSANGGGGQYAYNFNKWLSVVADIGAVHNGNIDNFQIDNTLINFMVGPRFSLRYSRLTPYFQALFGGVYLGASYPFDNTVGSFVTINPLTNLPIVVTPVLNEPIIRDRPVTSRFTTSQTASAYAFGGGLDIKFGKNMSFRPIGLDYFLTQLQNLRIPTASHQNNLRYTAGINFTFGAQ